MAKSDMVSAFRQLGVKPSQFRLLLLKAVSPLDGRIYFFAEKALAFGTSISCSHFQRTSRALSHIVKFRTRRNNVCYLDDFYFCALMVNYCNFQVEQFLEVCKLIKFPISMEKTCWATTVLIFLGLLIDSEHQYIGIPVDKVQRAKALIKEILKERHNKTTIKKLQKLTGFLNFLCRAVVPGRTFLR